MSSRIPFLLWLNSIPFCIYTNFPYPFIGWMNTYLISTSWLLWMQCCSEHGHADNSPMHRFPFLCTYIYSHMYSSRFGGSCVSSFFNFLRNLDAVFHNAYTSLLTHALKMHKDSLYFPILLNSFWLYPFLMGWGAILLWLWYSLPWLSVILRIFYDLMVICVSSLENVCVY